MPLHRSAKRTKTNKYTLKSSVLINKKNMEITGKLIEVTTPQELVGKNGKTYIKAMAILETEGQYPKKVAVDLKEALIDKLSSMPLFSMVTLKINLESREYNGKWYTSITAWSI